MKFSIPVVALLQVITASAQTLYLAGDSTMATINNANQQGWGAFVASHLRIPVVNRAIGGRSARSFTREGRFTSLANEVKAGDIVVIEFGHNDGGSLSTTDNGRTDCPGSGSETCQTVYNGVAETVYTYNRYLENASRLLISKGAKVIVASPTPRNMYATTDTWAYTPNRFTGYAELVTQRVSGVQFVDHGTYGADIYKTLGASTVRSYYPVDALHTNAAGADTIAKAFLKGAQCRNTYLAQYIKTTNLPGRCL